MCIPHARSKGGVGHAPNAFLNAAASRLVTVGYGWYGPPWAATCVLRERACTIPVTRCTLEAKADCLPLWSLGLALLITRRGSFACQCIRAVPYKHRCAVPYLMLVPCVHVFIFFLVVFGGVVVVVVTVCQVPFFWGVVCSVFFFFFHIDILFFSLSVSFLFVYLCTHLGPAPGNCFRLC